MTLEEDYLWITGNAFSEMRLLIEGAIVLYENDTGILTRMTAEAGEHAARYAINTIGDALYTLRKTVKRLEEEHRKEDERQRKPMA